MTETTQLIDFYVAEYRKEAKKKSNVRASGYEKRLGALNKTLKRLGPHQVSRSILEDYHRQIKNLFHLASKYRNKSAISLLVSQTIPQLVRLDLLMVLPDDLSSLDEGFF